MPTLQEPTLAIQPSNVSFIFCIFRIKYFIIASMMFTTALDSSCWIFVLETTKKLIKAHSLGGKTTEKKNKKQKKPSNDEFSCGWPSRC